MKTEKIRQRLDQLYRDLPIEYCGYALSAINDIEQIMHGADHISDKGYQVGNLEDIPKRNYHYTNTDSPIDFPKCHCYHCADTYKRMTTFIVCPKCGNKRCPHATDHNLQCTNSNEPGQEGSRY